MQLLAQESLLRARRAVDRGAWKDALGLYQQFLQQAPRHAEAHYELAWLLRAIDEPLQALSHYQRALDLGIARAEEIHLNRAVIFADELNNYAEAEKALACALALRPNYPEALLNRANLYEDQAQRSAALDCYQSVIDTAGELHAVTPLARARMLQLLGAEASETQTERAQDSAKRTQDAGTEASLFFAIAHVRHAQKRYAEAFALFVQANTINARGAPPYQPVEHETLCDSIIADLIALRSDFGPGVRREKPSNSQYQPLFIVGMFRSGSTLIEQVLNAHPQVQAFGEISFLPRLVASALQPFPNSLSAIPAETLAQWRLHYLSRFKRAAIADTVRYCTDKRPDNYLYLSLIKRLCPEAKIIFTVRNPIDNALSIFQQQLDAQVASYASESTSIAHNYAQHLRLLRAAQAVFAEDIFELNYDQFVENPQSKLSELLTFLGLPWNEHCLQFHQQSNAVRTASLWQVRQPINGASKGRWRAYRSQLEPLIQSLREHNVQLPSLD